MLDTYNIGKQYTSFAGTITPYKMGAVFKHATFLTASQIKLPVSLFGFHSL
jgi:hypothetical protein